MSNKVLLCFCFIVVRVGNRLFFHCIWRYSAHSPCRIQFSYSKHSNLSINISNFFFFFFLILYNDFLMPDKTMTMITILLAFHLDGQQPLLLWISIVLSENIILCIYTIIRATIQDLKFKMLVFWGRNLSNFIGLVQHLIGVWMLLQVAV